MSPPIGDQARAFRSRSLGLLLTDCLVTALAAFVIYLIASRRHVDPTDEGFYYASAWLAYSLGGDTPVGALLLNFGHIIGWPYWFTDRPSILLFRLFSLGAWYAVHAWFFIGTIRALDLHAPRWVAHLAALASLAIFLIPMLSYQNMPYLFVLLACALLLHGLSRPSDGIAIWAAILVSLSLAIVSSTIFLIVVPMVVLGLAWVWSRRRPIPWVGCAIGAVVGIAILAAVFDVSAVFAWRSTMAFFTSEMDYSSSGRLFERALALVIFLWPGLALGALSVLSAWALRRRFDQDRTLLTLASIGIFLVLGRGAWTACIVTCDAVHVVWINAAVIAAISTIAMLLRRGPSAWPTVSMLVLCGGACTFTAVISNAPFHYNLKFVAPVMAGSLLLLGWDSMRRWTISGRILPIAAGLALWGTALRILAMAHYGGEPPWESTQRLEGSAFEGLYGTPARADMLRAMQAAYRDQRCSDRPFAAVDSLVLPYFLFQRRPPFPHAWVGERVAASRAILAMIPSACVMMQDRVLPGTPKDSETMTGYLRLGPQDRVEVVPLGLNMFLVAFTRAGPA